MSPPGSQRGAANRRGHVLIDWSDWHVDHLHTHLMRGKPSTGSCPQPHFRKARAPLSCPQELAFLVISRSHRNRRAQASGTSNSECAISSMETSRKVSTFAVLTNRAGRYMSHTQASAMDTS